MSLAIPVASSLLRRNAAASAAAVRQPGLASVAFEALRAVIVAPPRPIQVSAISSQWDAAGPADRHLIVAPPSSASLSSESAWLSSLPLLSTLALDRSGGLSGGIADVALWLTSTLKKRKSKMNKHKLRKRRKKARLKSK